MTVRLQRWQKNGFGEVVTSASEDIIVAVQIYRRWKIGETSWNLRVMLLSSWI